MISLPNTIPDIIRITTDIFAIFILSYISYKLLRNTRAIPVIFGLLLLLGISVIAKKFNLETLEWAFESLSSYFIIAFLVALQPEIRKVFYRLGDVGFIATFLNTHNIDITEIISAITIMKEEKTGALLVIDSNLTVSQHIDAGVELNARLSKELLLSIFYGENPLHDGAVIIQKNKIVFAAAYLPLSQSEQLKKTHGSRHRAGLGIAEESDAFVIIVSEQRKKVSIAFMGILWENIENKELENILITFMNGKLRENWGTLFEMRNSSSN